VRARSLVLFLRPLIRRDQSNILVNDDQDACISDFGLSRILEVTGFTTTSVGGTCRWMARELIAPPEPEDEEESTPRVTTESDVWAFAMTVLEVK